MATSGTIGQTTIDTAKLLEHSFRRAGVSPAAQTPELVEVALDVLFMMIAHLGNRGLNLWCVNNHKIPLYANQRTYVLPAGSIAILNCYHHRPTLVSGTNSSGADFYKLTFTEVQRFVRAALKLTSAPNGNILIQTSPDDVTWTTRKTIALADAPLVQTWYDFDPVIEDQYIRVFDSGAVPALVVDSFIVSSGGTETEVTKLNRDDYTRQPNKEFSGSVVTDYFFEKLLAPQITCWPAPSADNTFLNIWTHRQIEDVGSLTQSLELPARWLEPIIVHLAMRLLMSIPELDQARLPFLKTLADEYVITSELDETDGAPSRWLPKIGAYNK